MSKLVQTYSQKAHNAWLENDVHALIDAYTDWQHKNCPYLQQVRIYDAHTASHRIIDVPCGKCFHCRQSHINEWVTRMHAHLEDFQNVYFVTLTYRPVYNPNTPQNQLYLRKMEDAVFHLDNYNSTKRLAYNPTLLCKKHYQNFLKRLRFNTKLSDLTYVVTGEYGFSYARPHMHLILFTNGELTKADIQKAWSISLIKRNNEWTYKTSHKPQQGDKFLQMPIGNVDFHDLVKNGTVNTTQKVKIDGNTHSLDSAFSYVCKYVCKDDHYNSNRVKIAYKNLFTKERYVIMPDKSEIPLEHAIKYAKNLGIETSYKSLRKLSYVKTLFKPSEQVANYNLQHQKQIASNHAELFIENFPTNYFDFRAAFNPFVEFSRGVPIGSIYAERHIHEFAQGVYKQPTLQVKSYVCPRYFVRKASELLYPLRRVSKTMSGTSYPLGNIPNLQRQFMDILQSSDARMYYSCSTPTAESLDALVKSSASLYDIRNKEYILMPYRKGAPTVEKYKYNRAKRKYELTYSTTDITSFCLENLRLIDDELTRNSKEQAAVKKDKKLLDRIKHIAIDMGVDWISIIDRYVQNQKAENDQRQREYHDVHTSVE